jgi:hypothetical protein
MTNDAAKSDVAAAQQNLVDAGQHLTDAVAKMHDPPAVVITTPAQLAAALTAATPGTVLTLDAALVVPTAVTIPAGVTLQSAIPGTGRMTRDAPAPTFLAGLRVVADDVTLVGLAIAHTNPLTDIVVLSGLRPVLDRCRILGDPVTGAKRGIAANGGAMTIRSCFIDDCFQAWPGNDSQAINAWDMRAPGLLVEDNFLSGGSESVMIGGADAATPERMPSAVTIRGNTITKNPAWQARPIGVKNTLELKACRDVLITDNDLSQSWGGHGQDGYLLLMTVRNQDGRAPWSTIQDVVVTGNRFSRGAGAINLLGLDNIKETKAGMPTPIGTVRPSVRMARITIRGNTFVDLDPVRYTGSNRLILIGQGPEQVTIDGNTFAGQGLGSQVYFYGAPPALGCTVTNNTWPKTTYGIKGDGSASGAATWAAYTSGGTLSGNVVTP